MAFDAQDRDFQGRWSIAQLKAVHATIRTNKWIVSNDSSGIPILPELAEDGLKNEVREAEGRARKLSVLACPDMPILFFFTGPISLLVTALSYSRPIDLAGVKFGRRPIAWMVRLRPFLQKARFSMRGL